MTVVVLGYPAWYGLAVPRRYGCALRDRTDDRRLFLGRRLAGELRRIRPTPTCASAGTWAATGRPPTTSAAGSRWRPGRGGGGRRRPLTWLLVLLAVVSLWLSAGRTFTAARMVSHVWLPWKQLSTLPVLKEILPDQFAPFIALFVAILVAVGVDAFVSAHRAAIPGRAGHRRGVAAGVTVVVALVALVPVFVHLQPAAAGGARACPAVYARGRRTRCRQDTVLLTVPFAVSGSTQPMFWQASGGMHFRLAGAALKTPNAVRETPWAVGVPGSPRRILTDLTVTRCSRTDGDAGPARRRARGVAAVARGSGRDRRRQP